MSSLIDKLLKAGSVSGADIMADSKFFNAKAMVPTPLPILNIAFSGDIDGGFTPGITILSGESKTFKSALSLYCLKAYLDKYDDAIGVLYDTEYGITPDYIKSFGIDPTRVIHIPVEHIEQLKFDFNKKLENINKGDHVFFLVDSIGQISSKKEFDDAHDEKSVADMTRAKSLRSLFRLVTIQLVKKDLPCIMVNHVYVEIGCLAGSTQIKTSTGVKEIQNIVPGDIVKSLTGDKVVEYKYMPDELSKEGKKFLRLDFEDGSHVLCTDNHKFLRKDGEWISAGEMTLDMEF